MCPADMKTQHVHVREIRFDNSTIDENKVSTVL